MIYEAIFGALGLFLLCYRLRPFRKNTPAVSEFSSDASVSIIVPCRNEEKNILPLMDSLQDLGWRSLEIIVVDDSSTDQTASLARAHGVKVLEAGPKPPGWSGKNWACWQGAQAASGDFILFTDADTVHRHESLMLAMRTMNFQNYDMMSAPPYHRARLTAERWLGFFYLLPLVATAAFQNPRPARVFAIGQYLLFRRESYFRLGGHLAIANELVDDIVLARRCLQEKLRYGVHPNADLFEVQMFSTWQEFVRGWTRLLRLGLASGSTWSVVEIVLIFHTFLHFSLSPLWIAVQITALAIVARSQRQYGPFRVLGVFLIPITILIFTLLTVNALREKFLRRAIEWRGRAYERNV